MGLSYYVQSALNMQAMESQLGDDSITSQSCSKMSCLLYIHQTKVTTQKN